MPIATTTKNGLMGYNIMKRRLCSQTFANDIIYKLGNINTVYSCLILGGAEIANGLLIDICIYMDNSKVQAIGKKESWLTLKRDTNGDIYIKVRTGWLYYATFTTNSERVLNASFQQVNSFPSNATDIPFK